jgi:hypothetical protein
VRVVSVSASREEGAAAELKGRRVPGSLFHQAPPEGTMPRLRKKRMRAPMMMAAKHTSTVRGMKMPSTTASVSSVVQPPRCPLVTVMVFVDVT